MIGLSSRFAASNRQSIEVYCTMSELLETLRQEGVDPAPAFTYYGKEVWEQALAALLCLSLIHI